MRRKSGWCWRRGGIKSPSPEGEGLQEARALAYRLGRTAALDRLVLTGANTAPLTGWDIPTFPLKGGDVVARGVKAGPEVARALKAIETGWIAAGFDDAAVPALLEAELAARR